MDETQVDITHLTVKEKAALVEQLIHAIVAEATSSEFTSRSTDNERIGGLFRTFGGQFTSTAASVSKFLRGVTD